MKDFDLFNNLTEPILIFDNNEIIFKNKTFMSKFPYFTTFERFKKHFNFNLCFLSSDNIANITPLDILLKSPENFHTVCSYQKNNGEYTFYYIYSFSQNDYKIVVFKDITAENSLNTYKSDYSKLEKELSLTSENSKKIAKLQEHAQAQVLKMGIINRISLLIRESNNIETIISFVLSEIHTLTGAFKTYYAGKVKNGFKIKFCFPAGIQNNDEVYTYENSVIDTLKNKEISVTSCLKESLNAEEILTKGVTRIIVPVYNKNNLLGIIVILTRHKFLIDENREILQSIAVQLSGSIVQSNLIEQLNKKNNKLQKTLNELKEAQIQLINTEKMASVGQLVSGVAHEINTPLASISSNNSLISKLVSNKTELSQEQYNMLTELNDINIEASKRIYNIVTSLKRFVRLDEAQMQKADINSELDLTLKIMAHELKNNIKVVKNYSPLPLVMCRVNMLNQVFMNLLINACHSINEKGISGEIKITTLKKGNNVLIKIKDNGMGIKEDVQKKIFNAGFTTKRPEIGTGLGLAISKKIVELHKGSISYTTKLNEGSEFTVSVPIN